MRSKQLYRGHSFTMPQLGTIDCSPFIPHSPQHSLDPLKHQHIQNIFQQQHRQPTLHQYCYVRSFQELCAKQNLYPLMLNASPQRLLIVCQDCLVLAKYQLEVIQEQIKVQLGKIYRIKMQEVPTVVKVGQHNFFIGSKTGRISQFSYKSMSFEGQSDQLQFPVMQLHIIAQQENKQTIVLGLDSAGNLVHTIFSHKTIMGKIIKTLTTSKWVHFQYRNKKREKIKKILKSLVSKQGEGGEQEVPTGYNKFHIQPYKQQCFLLAIYAHQSLKIFQLNSTYDQTNCSEIQKFQQPQELIFMELGLGGFQNSNMTHNVLTVGFRERLCFYRIIEAQDNFQVLKVAQHKTPSISLGTFISNNLLLLVTPQHITLANVSQNQQLNLIQYNKEKFSYVNFFIQEQGVDMDKRLQEMGCLSLIGQGRFMVLQGKRLIVGEVWNWRQVIERVVGIDGWALGMGCFLSVYEGHLPYSRGISENLQNRNQEMRQLCQVISKGYLLVEIKEQQIYNRFAINSLIYFMLRVQQSHLLFEQTYLLIQQHGISNIFMEELAEYLQQSNSYNIKIPYISEKVLELVIKRYKGRSDWVLQGLFMRFDLNQMQPLTLLTLCLRQQLYQSLIQICVRQKDFITPIVKLSGIRLLHPQKLPKVSSIIFWYLKECLQGRMTPFGDQQAYIYMLAMLLNFIFIPNTLQMLLQTNSQHLIRIVSLFFQSKILRCLLQNPQHFYMRKSEQDAIFQQSCSSQYLLYQKMLSTLIRVVQKSPERQTYQVCLNKLLILVMLSNQFPFLVKLRIKTILYYIQHPFLFAEKGQEKRSQLWQSTNSQLVRLLESTVRSISEKCLYLQQKSQDKAAIGQLSGLLQRQKKSQLNSIYQAMMLSEWTLELSQTKCYIQHQLGNYSQVLQLYLRMPQPSQRLKIFSYLQTNLPEFKELTQQFMKYMISLLHIDSKATAQLLWTLRTEWVQKSQIIDKLQEHPLIQLSYIEHAMQKDGQGGKKLLLRHLDIVLRQHPEEIEQYVRRINYPLQDAYRMCQQRNNRMGKACILIKSGRNMQGVTIISQIFLQAIQEYLRGLFKKLDIQPARKVGIMKQLQVVLDTCAKEYTIDNERGQDIWQKNTELIFKKLNVNNIDSPHIPDSIRSILDQIVTAILDKMLQQVSTDFFLKRFVRTFTALPVRIFLQAYRIIHHRLQFIFTFQRLNKEMVQNQQLTLWHSLMGNTYWGHICGVCCSSCGKVLGKNERMVSYPCQHVYHEQCYYQLNNKKNKNELCPLCYNSTDSFMVCSHQKLPRFRLQVDQNQLLKHKMNKMREYDRSSMLAALKTWSQNEQNMF